MVLLPKPGDGLWVAVPSFAETAVRRATRGRPRVAATLLLPPATVLHAKFWPQSIRKMRVARSLDRLVYSSSSSASSLTTLKNLSSYTPREVETTRSQSRSCIFLRNFLVLFGQQNQHAGRSCDALVPVGFALQVLKVAARQLVVGNDLDLAVTLLGDMDLIAEVADATLDLDLLIQELLEGRDIEDLVGGRLGGVDDELGGGRELARGVRLGMGRMVECHVLLTFLVTLPDLPFFCDSSNRH